jgi:hypothetical protein
LHKKYERKENGTIKNHTDSYVKSARVKNKIDAIPQKTWLFFLRKKMKLNNKNKQLTEPPLPIQLTE